MFAFCFCELRILLINKLFCNKFWFKSLELHLVYCIFLYIKLSGLPQKTKKFCQVKKQEVEWIFVTNLFLDGYSLLFQCH
jgi:hypothetical protein